MNIKVPKKSDKIDFEKTVAELEQLVATMESGELTLEESVKHFERGILLTRACQQALAEAEQTVSILMEKGKESGLEEFEPEDNNG